MMGDLQHCTDDELLSFVLSILVRDEGSRLSAYSLTELQQVEDEFMRRGTLCGECYDSPYA